MKPNYNGEYVKFKLEPHHYKVDESGCWLWVQRVKNTGYPQRITFTDGKWKQVTIHRFSCEAAHGPPPFDGALALHSCDVKRCVNPDHLRWGTGLDNAKDYRERRPKRGD